jgi:hypothetical protein
MKINTQGVSESNKAESKEIEQHKAAVLYVFEVL